MSSGDIRRLVVQDCGYPKTGLDGENKNPEEAGPAHERNTPESGPTGIPADGHRRHSGDGTDPVEHLEKNL